MAACVLMLPTAASADPGGDDQPSIESVQKQLDDLAVKNTHLVEAYNQAKQDVVDKQAAAKDAAQAARTAHAQFAEARLQLAKTVKARYESGAFSATGALLRSHSGENYLKQLTTLHMLADHTSQLVERLKIAQHKADAAKQKARKLFAAAKHKKAELAKQKKHVSAQIDKYTEKLAQLTAAQRRAYEQAQQAEQASAQKVAQVTKQVTVNAGSASAQQAVSFALAQIGKPYVFGAAGPNAYDCSGLTMQAWAQAGVSLPHSAARQYNYGTHIPFSQLQPGDLLFFYSPIGHVTIYVGDGMMVSAPQPGESVELIPADAFGSDFVGATRLTG